MKALIPVDLKLEIQILNIMVRSVLGVRIRSYFAVEGQIAMGSGGIVGEAGCVERSMGAREKR